MEGNLKNRQGRLPALLLSLIAFLFILASTASRAYESGRIKALIITLNSYRNWAPLDCPRADGELFKRTLIHRFRARESDITLLPEEKATRKGIEEALRELTENARPGETIVMLYAGHGAVVVDDRGEEPDGLSGCIVPIDAPLYTSPDFPSHVVRDRVIEEILDALVRKVRAPGQDGSVLFIFDSCHSGGMSRGELLADEKIRSARGVYEFMRAQVPAIKSRETIIRPHRAGSEGWVVLSACQEHEEARDNPSFSSTLAALLEDQRLTASSTYDDLMQLIGGTRLLEKQTPQCEGAGNIPILGGSAQPRTPSIKISNSFADSRGNLFLELDKGTLSGLTPGSLITVYPFGTKSPGKSAHKIGEARIEREDSGPYQAVAQWKSPLGVQKKDVTQAVAWLTTPAIPAAPLKIAFAPDLPPCSSIKNLRRAVDGELGNFAQEASKGDEADLFIYLTGEKGAEQVTLEALHAPSESYRKILMSKPLDSPGLAEDLSGAIKAHGQKMQFLRSTCSPQEIALSLVPGNSRLPASSRSDPFVSLHDGATMDIVIANRGDFSLFITLLNMESSGSMTVLFPLPGEVATWKPLSPGKSIRLPVAFASPRREGKKYAGIEGFKVVGTTEKIEAQYRASLGMERGAGARVSPFSKALGSFLGRAGGHRGEPFTTNDDPGHYVLGAPLWVRVLPAVNK